jgi:hypothetical protein
VRRPMRASLLCGLLAVALSGCARNNRVESLPGSDPGAAEVGAAGALAQVRPTRPPPSRQQTPET